MQPSDTSCCMASAEAWLPSRVHRLRANAGSCAGASSPGRCKLSTAQARKQPQRRSRRAGRGRDARSAAGGAPARTPRRRGQRPARRVRRRPRYRRTSRRGRTGRARPCWAPRGRTCRARPRSSAGTAARPARRAACGRGAGRRGTARAPARALPRSDARLAADDGCWRLAARPYRERNEGGPCTGGAGTVLLSHTARSAARTRPRTTTRLLGTVG